MPDGVVGDLLNLAIAIAIAAIVLVAILIYLYLLALKRSKQAERQGEEARGDEEGRRDTDVDDGART